MECNNCSGCTNCGGCGGCGGSLTLTRDELLVLQELAQVAFLPVARNLGEDLPIYPGADKTLILQLLEKKGLISLDYDLPLKGFSHPEYDKCPIRGSIALTNRGQQVLELVEFQGIDEICENFS